MLRSLEAVLHPDGRVELGEDYHPATRCRTILPEMAQHPGPSQGGSQLEKALMDERIDAFFDNGVKGVHIKPQKRSEGALCR